MCGALSTEARSRRDSAHIADVMPSWVACGLAKLIARIRKHGGVFWRVRGRFLVVWRPWRWRSASASRQLGLGFDCRDVCPTLRARPDGADTE